MAKVSKKKISLIVIIVVVAVAAVGVFVWYNSMQTKKRVDSVKREANLILTGYKSKIVYSGFKEPSDSEIADILPLAGVETIKDIKTSGEPTVDTVVLRVAENCDGSTAKNGAAISIVLPDNTTYCTD